MLGNEFRYAARRLRRRLASTALTVTTLTLGIAASLLAFTVGESVIAHSAPFPHADRLVHIGETDDGEETGTSLPAVERWATQSRTLEHVVGYTSRVSKIEVGGVVTQDPVAYTTGDLFRTLGVRLTAGQGITTRAGAGAAPVAVVSHAFWIGRLAGRRDAIGATVQINDAAHTVVGIAPPAFDFPQPGTQLWASVEPTFAPYLPTEGVHVVEALARLRLGHTVTSATADLRTMEAEARESREALDARGERQEVFIRPLRDQVVRDLLPRVRVLLAAGLAMLLLGCTHAAGMMLTEALRRRGELAVRQALGAGELDMIRLVAAESLVLTSTATVLGVALAAAAARGAAVLASSRLPELRQLPVTSRTGVAAVGLAVGVSAVLSALTWRQIRRHAIARSVRDAAGGDGDVPLPFRLRGGIITATVAITMVLALSAGVLGKTYADLAGTSLGYSLDNVFVARVWRPLAVHTPENRERTADFAQRLLARLQTAPAIAGAALTTQAPGSGNGVVSVAIADGGAGDTRVGVQAVTADYFRTLGIPLRRGQPLPVHGQGGVVPAVVEAGLARRLFGTGEAVGRSLELRDLAMQLRVIGVVGEVRQAGATGTTLPQVYIPYGDMPLPWITIVLRSTAPAATVRRDTRAIVASLDGEQAVEQFGTLRDVLASRLDRSRFYASLLGLFAGASLLLTGISLYGAVRLVVAQRAREMSIRVCLGASALDVVARVVRQTMLAVLAGVIVGCMASVFTSRLLESLLYGVRPLNATVLLVAVGLVAAIAAAASVIPALRAATRAPAAALRGL